MTVLSPAQRTAAGVSVVVWIALAVALAASDEPWSNEAWAAIPALNLAHHGSMETTVLAPNGTWLVGIDRHTYWMMPLHLLVQAAWYKTAGFSLIRQRLLSVMFGLAALLAWFTIVGRLSSSAATALVSVLIIGFERNFLNGAASGRMDMMSAALGAMAIAAYLKLADGPRWRALLASHALAAAAVFTHPCGALWVAALFLTMLLTGGWSWKAADLACICAPYLAGLAAWGVYIGAAPADFKAQFFGNVNGFAGEYLRRERFHGITAPWRAVWLEIKLRYLDSFGLDSVRGVAQAVSASWLTAAVCLAGWAVVCRPREEAVRVLSAAGLAVFLLMALLEGMKFQIYLVHSLPFLGALAGVGWSLLWPRTARRAFLGIGLAVLLLAQAAGPILHFRRNALKNGYHAPAGWLKAALRPGDQLIAPAEFGYDLGFGNFLSDDVHLGFRTGIRPRFIVTSDWYRQWMERAMTREPEVYRYEQELLKRDYHPVLTAGDYVIYERNKTL